MKFDLLGHKQLNERSAQNPFWDRRWLVAGILSLIGLFGTVALVFIVFNYGGYLYESGQTRNYRYYQQMLKSVSQLNFTFLKNYTEGQLAELDNFTIDLKFKHLMRMRYLRDQAKKENMIDPVFKEEEFPALLTYNGQTHDVKIGLTGKMSRTHLGDPNKWSFQVRVKGDDAVMGMKRFGLLLPTVRGYLTDWLSVELMKERGLIGIRINFVTITMNGKPNGVYYVEERFDKHLIENNQLREGIIFKLEKEVLAYQENKLMRNPETKRQLLLLKRMWQNVVDGQLSPQQFFDMEKMAKLFVIADLINIGHPLNKENLRFYFNPVTGLAEPIAREFEDLEENDPASLKVFLERPQPFSTHFWHKEEAVIGLITGNDDFKRLYLQEAALVCQKKFLDEFFERKKEKIQAIQTKLFREWPYYEIPVQVLYNNQKYIRSVLFPETNELLARFKGLQDGKIGIYLKNQQYLPLEISHLSWQDSILLYPNHSILLHSKEQKKQTHSQLAYFQIPKNFTENRELFKNLSIQYHLLGLPEFKKTVTVLPPTEALFMDNSRVDTIFAANYGSFDFIEEKSDGEVLSLVAGTWTVDRNLIVPANKELHIKAGVIIDLVNGAKIISYSPLYFQGLNNKPIVIQSSDGSGEGLIVIDAEKPSLLSYTNFDGLSSSRDIGLQGSGVVTFHNSPVNIFSSTFTNNHQKGDFLRISHSNFTIDGVVFKNVQADAINIDYCSGTITNSSFYRIGENGIDIVEAEVKVAKVFMDGVSKYGLSTAENGSLDARWIDIRHAATGIITKDRSRLTLADAQLLDNHVGLVVQQNLIEFGPSFASVKRLDLHGVDIPYMIDKSCHLKLDDNIMRFN